MKLLKASIVCMFLACTVSELPAAALFGFGKKETITENDKALREAIVKGDWRRVNPLLLAGANPNAKFEDTTLFVQAFEHSLQRDENNKISKIDSNRADIARMLASAGGNIKELERDLPHYEDKKGKPLANVFESPEVEKAYTEFVMHLRNNAALAKGKKI